MKRFLLFLLLLPTVALAQPTPGNSFKITDGSHTAAVTAASALKTDSSAVTQPVSASSLPLPAGASTAAKQPALGTAGSAAADVLTVQGVASMTPLKTDGSGVTQPVSGTVTISGNVDITPASPVANDYISCRLTDGTSFYAASGGGGGSPTEYTEDAASAADPVGGMLIARRRDTLTGSEVSTDGDNIALNATNKGQLQVKLADTVIVDGSGVTQPVSASSLPLPTGAATSANQTTGNSSLSSIDGKITAVNTGAVVVSSSALPTGAATESTLSTLNGKVTAVNTGAVVVASGSLTANAGTNLNTSALALESGGNLATIAGAVKAEDAASVNADTGIPALAIRKATPANTSSTDGDYETLQESGGRLWTSATIDAALPAGTNVIGHVVADSGSAAACTQSGTWTVQPGNTANTTPWKVDASSVAVPVTDNGGSLTVDAPVGTPAFVRLSDGASAISTLPVSLASVPSHAVTNAGTFAVQEADGANTTLGTKADAKSTATDTTAITAMSVLKQISASVQAPPSQAVTNAGTFAVQEADGANTTLGSKADAKNTATDTTAVSAISVLKQISASVQAPPSQAVTNAGTFAVQATLQANSGVDIGKLTANQSVNVAQVAGTTTDTNSGNKSAGTQRVVLATDQPSPTNAFPASQSGTWTVQPGNTANSTPWLVTTTPGTTGGWSVSSQTALSNTKTSVKASAATLGGWMFYNPNASVEYIQVWDVASGSVTVGTTAPTYVIPIPATSGANVEFANGINHATAIVIAATTTPTGSTAPGTALTGFIAYK